MNIYKITSKFSLLAFISIALLLGSCQKKSSSDSSSKLWYKQPANASIVDDTNGWRNEHE
ncbi:MAG: hypothetical protein ABFR62_03580 [Bacteroidota bacterium]